MEKYYNAPETNPIGKMALNYTVWAGIIGILKFLFTTRKWQFITGMFIIYWALLHFDTWEKINPKWKIEYVPYTVKSALDTIFFTKNDWSKNYIRLPDKLPNPRKYSDIKRSQAEKKVENLQGIRYWDRSNKIRELQEILKRLWFFHYKEYTTFFWPKTKQALIDYQISHHLIKNWHSKWAWIFWPQTRKALINDLSKL